MQQEQKQEQENLPGVTLCEEIRAIDAVLKREIRAIDLALETADLTTEEDILAGFLPALLTVSDTGEDECCRCGAVPASFDALGLAWCEAPSCRSRRDFLAFGRIQDYPALQSLDDDGFYACAAGIWHWLTTALSGSDDYLGAMMAAIVRRIEAGEDKG